MTPDQVTPYLDKLNQLKTKRVNYDSLCQEVADFTLPRRDFTVTRDQNTKRNVKIYDSTAIYATGMLASGLHGYLTPPSSKWFNLRVKGVNETLDDRKWLDQVTDIIFLNFASPDSLFSSQSYEMYLDLVAFGMGVMFPVYVDGRVTYISRDLRNCWVRQNNVGIIDTLYYVEEYRPVEIVRMAEASGWDIHDNVRKAYEGNKQVKFKILHAVEPRDENYGPGSVATKKPFASCYIDIENKQLMKESGFDSFPYLVPRFTKRSGDTYGYGPGMDALPEVRVANQMTEAMYRLASKNADPNILAPHEGVILPMRLDPGGISYYNPEVGKPEFWSNNSNPSYLASIIKDKQELIRNMYFSAWMTTSDKRDMTATEVIQNSQDNMRQMGPTLSRMEAEFLSKLINRTFEILMANGKIPKPPASSQGKPIAIEYTSPMAQAQRVVGSNSIMQALSMFAQLAQFDPAVVHNIDTNTMARDQALNTFNFPAKYLFDVDTVAQNQEAAAQAAQIAAAGPVAESYGKGINQLSQAGAQNG